MGYTKRLLERQERLGRPVRVGIVGAGQMGSGLVAQVHRAQGMDIVAVADIDIERAETALRNAGRDGIVAETDVERASELIQQGKAVALDDGLQLPKLPVDIVLEVSGVPDVAAQVAMSSLLARKDVALMTVEADVTVGLLLARTARIGDNVYTVCRGDEPVECITLVEYAQDLGLEVVVAGKGKNNPMRPTDTPTDVAEEARRKGMNPKMLCSFTDGSKTQVEMCSLSNGTGLRVEIPGMHGIACDVEDLAKRLVPKDAGGIIETTGVVEYVTGNVAPGVFVIVKSLNDVVTHELDYLKLGTGPYYALYRPYHLASIEASLSVGQAIIDRQPSFQTVSWTSEVTAKTKSDVSAGTTLEGIGGHHVHGFTVTAEDARKQNAIPIGLVAGCTLKRDIAAGTTVTYADVEVDETRPLVAMRRLQDALIANGTF